MRSDEANEREGIDVEKSEALLRLYEINAIEEEIRVRVRVVEMKDWVRRENFEVKGFELEL